MHNISGSLVVFKAYSIALNFYLTRLYSMISIFNNLISSNLSWVQKQCLYLLPVEEILCPTTHS